jgi:histidinol dehydrogenase
MKTVSRQFPIRILSSADERALRRVFSRRAERLDAAERAVAPIIRAVVKDGDRALVRYARRWDGFEGSSASQLRVSPAEIAEARRMAGADFLRAIREAARNIRGFCRLQMPQEWMRTTRPGVRLGQVIRPLESVGCYIPGGRYPLPSTLLMTAIPAQVAGVGRVVVATPRPAPEILAAAGELGIEEIYTVGGAPAIAALAYGTRTIAPVSKIVGPGNAYVAAAKRTVSRDVAIDFVAGPSEVLLIAQDGEPAWLAADLLAQAEHDVDAAALLLVTSAKLAEAVASAVAVQLPSLGANCPAATSLRKNCAIVVVRDLEEAVALANRFAPEHLSVPEELALDKLRNAGSIFVGPYSPEAAGDYSSGPNHVLPTGGMAAVRGGLSVLDFVKIISVQRLSERGLRSLAPSIVMLARSEGLEAHARSIEIRFSPINQSRDGQGAGAKQILDTSRAGKRGR